MSRNRGHWTGGQPEARGPIEPMDYAQPRDWVSFILWAIVGFSLAAMVLK